MIYTVVVVVVGLRRTILYRTKFKNAITIEMTVVFDELRDQLLIEPIFHSIVRLQLLILNKNNMSAEDSSNG